MEPSRVENLKDCRQHPAIVHHERVPGGDGDWPVRRDYEGLAYRHDAVVRLVAKGTPVGATAGSGNDRVWNRQRREPRKELLLHEQAATLAVDPLIGEQFAVATRLPGW